MSTGPEQTSDHQYHSDGPSCWGFGGRRRGRPHLIDLYHSSFQEAGPNPSVLTPGLSSGPGAQVLWGLNYQETDTGLRCRLVAQGLRVTGPLRPFTLESGEGPSTTLLCPGEPFLVGASTLECGCGYWTRIPAKTGSFWSPRKGRIVLGPT